MQILSVNHHWSRAEVPFYADINYLGMLRQIILFFTIVYGFRHYNEIHIQI